MAGAVAGFVWGGVFGRIAMRIVFLTSDDRVRGATSDDGFEIGRFSADTIALLIFTAILGAIVGVVFGAVRAFLALPTRFLAPVTGVAAAMFGGGAIVHSDGIDFRALEPLWLTVGLFVLIPGAWGVSVVFLSDRLFRSGRLVRSIPSNYRVAGVVGVVATWIFLGLITAFGAIDLIRDISDLA